MDSFFSVKKLFLSFLLLLSSYSAFADAPSMRYRVDNAPGSWPYDVSTDAACARWAASKAGTKTPNGEYDFTGDFSIIAGPKCQLTLKPISNGGLAYNEFFFSSQLLCSDSSSPDRSKPLDQQCSSACPAAGTPAGSETIITAWATGPDVGSAIAKKVLPDGNPAGTAYCDGMCGIRVTSVQSCSQSQIAGPNGYYKITCEMAMENTGSSCTPSGSTPAPNSNAGEPSEPPPEKNRCPEGTVSGGTDSSGIPICIGKPSKNEPKIEITSPPTTTANPDGSTTTTQKTARRNSDGSITTTTITTTTGADGTSTTTTSSETGPKPGSTSGSGTDDSSEDEAKDFCVRHPELNICKNSQISGECDAVSCSGDAIQCAIARMAAAKKCKDERDEEAIKVSPEYALGTQVLAGNDPLKDSFPSPEKAQLINIPTALNQSGFLGGGGCPADKVVSVHMLSFTIPYSLICPHIVAMRAMIMLLAAFASFYVFHRGIFK